MREKYFHLTRPSFVDPHSLPFWVRYPIKNSLPLVKNNRSMRHRGTFYVLGTDTGGPAWCGEGIGREKCQIDIYSVRKRTPASAWTTDWGTVTVYRVKIYSVLYAIEFQLKSTFLAWHRYAHLFSLSFSPKRLKTSKFRSFSSGAYFKQNLADTNVGSAIWRFEMLKTATLKRFS